MSKNYIPHHLNLLFTTDHMEEQRIFPRPISQNKWSNVLLDDLMLYFGGTESNSYGDQLIHCSVICTHSEIFQCIFIWTFVYWTTWTYLFGEAFSERQRNIRFVYDDSSHFWNMQHLIGMGTTRFAHTLRIFHKSKQYTHIIQIPYVSRMRFWRLFHCYLAWHIHHISEMFKHLHRFRFIDLAPYFDGHIKLLSISAANLIGIDGSAGAAQRYTRSFFAHATTNVRPNWFSFIAVFELIIKCAIVAFFETDAIICYRSICIPSAIRDIYRVFVFAWYIEIVKGQGVNSR